MLAALFVWSICIPVGAAPSITVTGGSWYLELVKAYLEPGPGGSNLKDHYRSLNHDPVTTKIDVTGATAPWSVSVRRSGSLPAGFKLKVKRQDGGSGPGTVSGGTTYMAITGSDTLFFSGTGTGCGDIDIQYRLTNVTISGGLTKGTYSTTITYTVSDAS